ncbi:MAG: ABC transporter, ATP-binding protein (cluster 3, basic aa/glutamine/opines), partial [uncultured Pseudonocardia sp.]
DPGHIHDPHGVRRQALRRPARPARHRPGGGTGPGRGGARPVGVGQVHAVPHDQPARADRLGHDRGRRRRAPRRGQGAGRAARGRRHGVPELQPVRAQDDPRERHARPAQGAQGEQGRGREGRPGPPRARRHRQPEGQVPRAALRRAAAAGRHRPRPGDEAQGHAVRRAHLRARPGDGQRGPRRHDHAGQGGHDDARGHPRDGLRPPRRPPRGVHERRRDRRGLDAGRLLRQPQLGPRQGLPRQDPHPL